MGEEANTIYCTTAMKYLYVLFVIAICTFAPKAQIHAAEVLFSVLPNHTEGDLVTIIDVQLNSEGEFLNAVEGKIAFFTESLDSITSVLIETGDSVVSLWPVVPTYSKEEGVIRFTGGSTESFSDRGSLFRIRVFSKEERNLTLSWIGGSAYHNDGIGTQEGISSRSLTVSLIEGRANIINPVSSDSEPPYFDALYVSHDQEIYEDRYFLSFHARDNASGISHYDVVEGQRTTRIEVGELYVLQDQERKTKVVVIAYDQAGNSTSVKVPTRYAWLQGILSIGALVLITTIVLSLCIRTRRICTLRTK